MTSVDKQDIDCKEGFCETNFRPVRRTFQNLKAMASGLMEKVKESLSGDEHESLAQEAVCGETTPATDKTQLETVKENTLGTESGTGHLSMHSTAILNSFVQNSWQPFEEPKKQTGIPLKMQHVRPRAPEGLVEAPRYSNPWRYDARH